MRNYCLITLLLACLVGCAQDKVAVDLGSIPQAQLPDTAIPQRYNIELTVLPEQARFTGHVEIDVQLTESTSRIWLHGNQLRMGTVQIVGQGVVEAEYRQITPFGVALLDLPRRLQPGRVKLIFDYSAPFDESLEGLYRVKSKQEAYAFTQFEATSARLAFPGFDEPRHKVPFELSITTRDDYEVIANSPVKNVTALENGMKKVSFVETKPLPTYLLAFAVGAFDIVEYEAIPSSELRARPIPLRGVTTRGKGEEIRYALANTAAMVSALEAYFGTAYPYRKLDLLAVPDFAAGAMENAGAITYRESLLLLNESAETKQLRSFREVHAHELAHQWFGNLVTPQWWNDIWLNESFASWMSYKILDQLYPGEGYMSEMLNRANATMAVDALASARQIREPITRHQQIGAAFDAITYRKGAGVLHMFEQYVGEANFRAGVRDYMRRFAWGNTRAEDFIHSVANADEQPQLYEAVMSFLEQPGVPLLTLSGQCGANEVSQSRYRPLGSQIEGDAQWLVPACFKLKNGEARCELITDKQQTLEWPGVGCEQLVFPNLMGSSYFRFSVDDEHWQSLVNQIDWLDANEQIALISSMTGAQRSGDLSVDRYIVLLEPLIREGYWRAVGMALDELGSIYATFPEARVDTWRKQLQTALSSRLLAARELASDSQNALFTARLESFLAFENHDLPLLSLLQEEARLALTDTGFDFVAVPADRTRAILRAAALSGDEVVLQRLKMQLAQEDNAIYRSWLLGALAASNDKALVEWLQQLVFSPAIRDNEVNYVIKGLVAQASLREPMARWLDANGARVAARMPAWNRGKVIAYYDGLCSADWSRHVSEKYSKIAVQLEGGERILANTQEKINLCAAWLAANL